MYLVTPGNGSGYIRVVDAEQSGEDELEMEAEVLGDLEDSTH